MTAWSRIGAALVVLGLGALSFESFRYTRPESVFDVAVVDTSHEAGERVAVSPIAGSISLIGGVALMFLVGRRPPIAA